MSKYFSKKELDCNCCGKMEMNKTFMKMLEEFREWYNKPMVLGCGYRCVKHNKEVGGWVRSNHVTGSAIDWNLPKEWKHFDDARKQQWRSNVIKKWQELGKKYNVYTEIGIYKTFTHLAIRTHKPYPNRSYVFYK